MNISNHVRQLVEALSIEEYLRQIRLPHYHKNDTDHQDPGTVSLSPMQQNLSHTPNRCFLKHLIPSLFTILYMRLDQLMIDHYLYTERSV